MNMSQLVSKGVVERKRLLLRLIEARHLTCVFIQGPAGSGKTTLVSQWRLVAMSYGYDLAAITVNSGDDGGRMVESLIACLERVDPALALEAAFVHKHSSETRSAEPTAIAIIRALTKHPRELVLMIDDYHLMQDALAHRFVQMLLDFAPPNFHLLLASRSEPSLSLARLRDKGSLLELGFSDLRFSLKETEELLSVKNAELQFGDVRVLHEMTDGWAAGLGLVALTLGSRPERTRFELHTRLQNAGDFRTYFNRNVLTSLALADVADLTRLAAAKRFDEGLCAVLFGLEAGQGLLERLRRENVFLIPIESKEAGAWFRFHPLFRDQLKELFEQLPQSERDQTHMALSEAFGRRNYLREAVYHCVAAGKMDRAVEWVESHAQVLFLNGELRLLVRAVAELPSQVLRSSGSLRIWMAWSQLCYRQLSSCRESVEELKVILPLDNKNGQNHLTLLEAGLALQQDDTEAAARLLPELDAMATERDAILAGARRNILGWFHGQRNEGTLARAKLAGPHFLLENGEPFLESGFGFLMGECLKGYSYVKEGNMREAERELRETLRKSESVLGPYCEAAANAAGFLSPVLYEIDELPALRALLEPRMDLVERAGMPDAVICAYIMHSRMCQCERSFQEALADVERLEEIALQRGLTRTLAIAFNERITIQIKIGDPQAAEDTLAKLCTLASRQAGRSSNTALAVRWHASLARTDWLAALRRDQEALDELQTMISSGVFEEKLQARAQLFARSAVLHERLMNKREALMEIAKAWHIAQRMGLVRSMLDLGHEVLLLGENAQREGLMDEAALFHLEYVTQRARRHVPSLSPPPLPMHGSLSEREIVIVKALAMAVSNKRIAQALDISPETVKWHLKNVYFKLGVYARDGAVRRARELGYIEPHS